MTTSDLPSVMSVIGFGSGWESVATVFEPLGSGGGGAADSQYFQAIPEEDEQAIWDELDRTAMTFVERDELSKIFQSRSV